MTVDNFVSFIVAVPAVMAFASDKIRNLSDKTMVIG